MNDHLDETTRIKEYATKDLHFASFLKVKGVTLLRLDDYGRDQRGQNPLYFVFEDRKLCEKLETAFWEGHGKEAVVNARDYMAAVKDLRSRLFSIVRPRPRRGTKVY